VKTKPDEQRQASSFDGVGAAILTSRFQSVVESMSNTMLRTARSGIINTAHDFSCCILTNKHELLAMANSLPIHVLTGPDVMTRSVFEFHDVVRPGDAFLHNSPYSGNSHAADHSIIIPVFDEDGKHRFTAFMKAHMADCGNALPTTYMAAARDVYEEGALIFPAVKIQENYKYRDDILRMCALRIRAPEQWRGDMLALVGSARIGERLVKELGGEVGWDALEEYSSQWFDYCEQLMIDAIRELPSGRVAVDTAHDPFPGVPDGVPIHVEVTVDADAATIEVDLRDNIDCLPCGLNTSESTARNAALTGIFNSLPRIVPNNSGSFRRLKVHLRENCAVGFPRHPASCSVATTALANRVGNGVQRALAELADGVGMGEIGLIMAPTMASISGRDPRHGGRPFANQVFFGHSGGAARHDCDGWMNIGDLGAGAMILLDSIEVSEANYPLRVIERRIAVDSEGAGRQRGAPGAFVEFEPVGCDLDVMYASDGTFNPARGARGGGSGAPATQFRRERSGELTLLPVFDKVEIPEGTTIVSTACGGGGYGRATERDPESVRFDVLEGMISRERAFEVYGVVLNPDGAVDMEATRQRRLEIGEDERAGSGG
jgi:N-methylhydantoinase B